MSSGWGHSVPPVASAAKECHGISADVGEATFCAGPSASHSDGASQKSSPIPDQFL